MAWISLTDTVWVESYSDAAPLKCANGTIIHINWRDGNATVQFDHPDGTDYVCYDFDELQDAEYHAGLKSFMIFDVADKR